MVAGEGLEPSILSAADFKSAVYTNSTTQPKALPTGLEPVTPALGKLCSIHLSYESTWV